MKGLGNILIEGRVEDAQKYFENAVGSWPVAEPGNPVGIGVGTNLQGVLDHFVNEDPSGNNKYLMWMIKTYINEESTAPFEITSVVKRFHKNLDRLTPAFIMNMDVNFGPDSRIITSPKNIDSYNDLDTLERVMDEMDAIQTKKEKEKEAKEGVDKLYEDDRWLLVKPNTYEGSCYYGSATKWCTASKDYPKHFEDYSKKGLLFYIIDKTKDVGDFFKIALFKKWNGDEEWYDRADNRLEGSTVKAIESLLPLELTNAIEEEYVGGVPDKDESTLTLEQFKSNLNTYILNLPRPITISTETGKWELEVNSTGNWEWAGQDPRVELIATPFYEGNEDMSVYFRTDDDDLGQPALEYRDYYGLQELSTEYLGPGPDYQFNYLSTDPNTFRPYQIEKAFISQIYIPLVRRALKNEELKDYTGLDYTTWDSQSYVSSYTFKYPPKQGGMTQLFTDYLKDNPRSTPNQFYEDVLGRPRPRAHNNMFFAAIKDSGIVKMERQGRQFVYSLGPNYDAWTQGKLLRRGRAYGQPG